MTKVCRLCGEEKRAEEFYKYRAKCKCCYLEALSAKRGTIEAKQGLADKQREYMSDPLVRERRDAYKKIYNKANKAALAAQRKEYRSRPSVIIQRKLAGADYRRRPEVKIKQAELGRAWCASNRERAIIRVRRHQALKLGLEGWHTIYDIEELWIEQLGRCVYCSTSISTYYEVDHITPVSRNGTNWAYNLQLLCKSCNCSKNNKNHEEYLAYLKQTGRLPNGLEKS